ncbi:hypothetical protein MHYP_G00366080 [Metynnis hypsauchen]
MHLFYLDVLTKCRLRWSLRWADGLKLSPSTVDPWKVVHSAGGQSKLRKYQQPCRKRGPFKLRNHSVFRKC